MVFDYINLNLYAILDGYCITFLHYKDTANFDNFIDFNQNYFDDILNNLLFMALYYYCYHVN